MEVKTKEKIEMTKELKADSNDKETSRKEHNDRLQSVRERKLQQLRYKFKFLEILITKIHKERYASSHPTDL